MSVSYLFLNFVAQLINEIMKKLLLLLFTVLSLASCSSSTNFWTGRPKDAVMIVDYSARMETLKKYFPEKYNLYCQGKLVIVEMYMYDIKNGDPKVKVVTRPI